MHIRPIKDNIFIGRCEITEMPIQTNDDKELQKGIRFHTGLWAKILGAVGKIEDIKDETTGTIYHLNKASYEKFKTNYKKAHPEIVNQGIASVTSTKESKEEKLSPEQLYHKNKILYDKCAERMSDLDALGYTDDTYNDAKIILRRILNKEEVPQDDLDRFDHYLTVKLHIIHQEKMLDPKNRRKVIEKDLEYIASQKQHYAKRIAESEAYAADERKNLDLKPTEYAQGYVKRANNYDASAATYRDLLAKLDESEIELRRKLDELNVERTE